MMNEKKHDLMNLFSLLAIVLTSINSLIANKNHFTPILIAFIYILVDTYIIYKYPNCVKSQKTILFHHIITLIFFTLPFSSPKESIFCILDLLVEINTLLLIIKKYCKNPLIKKAFNITWVFFRIILYPTLFIISIYKIPHYNQIFKIIAPLCQFILCIMNFKWTYDIFYKTKKNDHKQL